MTSRVWTKPQTQRAIKDLRSAGFIVDRLDAGYKCEVNGVTVFKAMQGHRGYLVTYDSKLFYEDEK